MQLVELVENGTRALKVRDVAQLLGVSAQQIYKMAAKGEIPSFKVANAVRFDPHDIATWLRQKYPARTEKLPIRAPRTA
jgi:excisionase family DNA binding protein